MSDKLKFGDKEITLDVLAQSLSAGIKKAIGDDGEWKQYNLKLEFQAKRDGEEISITAMILSASDEKLTAKEKKISVNPEKFMKELDKI